jgi:hypothetical protein
VRAGTARAEEAAAAGGLLQAHQSEGPKPSIMNPVTYPDSQRPQRLLVWGLQARAQGTRGFLFLCTTFPPVLRGHCGNGFF